ncbi:MAG: STAS domain-containing protein [Planctomycetaceae bacterium]|jgi:anti-anti-sigma factor
MTSSGPAFELQPRDSFTVIRFCDSRLLAADRITGIDRDVGAWLTAHPGARVILDLSAVEAVSSDFLAKLIGWRTQVQKSQGGLKLTGLGPVLQELFDVTRLSKKFEIEPDVETAAARLGDS